MLTASFTIQSAFAEQLPLEHFFKKPQYAGFQLSPDGENLGVLAPVEGRMNLVIINLKDRKPVLVTGEKDQDIRGFMWTNNNRLLFFMDKDGNESFGIFAVNKDASKFRVLAEPVESQVNQGRRNIEITAVLDPLIDDDDHVLVTNNKRRSAYSDVYKMNVNTGRKRLVMRNPGDLTGWFTDWEGNIFGAGYADGLYTGVKLYNPETEKFEEKTRFRFDEPSFSPAYFKEDMIHGYAQSTINPDGSARDKAALFEFNLDTMELGNLVYEHDTVDCCGVIGNRELKDIIGVAHMVGKPEVVYLNEVWKARMDGINQALPDTMNNLSSMDRAETIGIVTASNSTQPPRYFLFDMEKGSLEPLPSSMPWIKSETMAEMKPITFKARDGLTLHGYLTLPQGSDGKNLPLIVNPHGGPWARDGWGFNPETQFLANRGYAVIQVNFRGSTGFGRAHQDKADKQWGQAMQNDVSDALQWAIDEGIADEDRVCIYGGSYGGYATMAGLTFTPDLYQCGINYVGVTSLPLLFETMPTSWDVQRAMMIERVGDYDNNREFLEEWSPTNHADKIQVPVFMAYGLRDPRVDIEHAFEMEKAMKKNDVEYELMIKKREGHGFVKQENRYDFYGRMETFLAENLND
jgi:dipeptidyl aminopeptidase/acylaminoacyl peptidase